MSSRVSLSLLAFVCGLAVMFVSTYYGLIPVPELRLHMATEIFVLVGGVMVVIGWIKIFRRRSQSRSEELSLEPKLNPGEAD